MLIVVTVIFVPFLIPLQYIYYFFKLIGQPEQVSEEAAVYVRLVSPGIIAYFWMNCYDRLAQGLGKNRYCLYATAGASLVHMLLAPFLATHCDMKMKGIAISTMVHFLCRFLIQYFFCVRDKDMQKCMLSIFHPDSFSELKYTFKVGFASFLHKCMGWWAFDVFTQLA